MQEKCSDIHEACWCWDVKYIEETWKRKEDAINRDLKTKKWTEITKTKFSYTVWKKFDEIVT